jgi:hypothetical protein
MRQVRIGIGLFALFFAVLGPVDRIQAGTLGLRGSQHLIGSGVQAIPLQSPVEDVMAEEFPTKIVGVRIAGPERAVRALLSRRPMDIGSLTSQGNKIVLEVFVPEPVVGELNGEDLDVQVLFDASARGRERQKEVGQGNRFVGERLVPSGLGTKTREGQR